MLNCDVKEIVFSSYAGNVYEVQTKVERKGYFRNYQVMRFPNKDKYQLYILDYYGFSDGGKSYRNWMEGNFEESFGGRIEDSSFIWPVDYVSEYERGISGKSSLGLFFSQKQLDDVLQVALPSEEKFVVQLFLPLFHSIKKLHEKKVYLNGINIDQLLFSKKDEKVKIQVLHNCICETGVGKDAEEYLTEGARYLYQDKAFSLPLGSGWKTLKLGAYARCNDIYSLASILFYVIIGRHPLNGRLCDDLEDKEGRRIIYNQNPCFIFDKFDKRNEIGQFAEEKEAIAKWERLNQEIKELFWDLYTFPDFNDTELEKKTEKLECFQLDSWVEILNKIACK